MKRKKQCSSPKGGNKRWKKQSSFPEESNKRQKKQSSLPEGGSKTKEQSKFTDLDFDMMKRVLFFVAASPEGAGDLARTLSVCKLFKELADDSDILKGVVFDQVKLTGIHESFWRHDGLLSRCLQIGNHSSFSAIRKNADIMNVSYQALKRDMFRGKMILLARNRALEIANTRARKKALEEAINYNQECEKTFEAIDAQISTIEQFLEMMIAAVKEMRNQITRWV